MIEQISIIILIIVNEKIKNAFTQIKYRINQFYTIITVIAIKQQ